MTDFVLKGKVQIKSKTAEEWKTWQESSQLDVGQLGYITDKGYLVCGDGSDEKIFLEDSEKFVFDQSQDKFVINGRGQLPFFVTAPMYSFGHKNGEDTEIVYRRSAEDYIVPDNTMLMLYNNYNDFDESIINPDDLPIEALENAEDHSF